MASIGYMGDEDARCIALFHEALGLAASGDPDAITMTELFGGDRHDVGDDTGGAVVASSSMPWIIVHWTAVAHKASAVGRERYHILIEGD